MNNLANKIAKNTFFNFISQAIGFICALILSVLTARLLGPNKFGSYALVGFVLSVAEILTNLGLSNVVTKYLSEFSGENDRAIRSGIFFYVLKIKIIATLIVTITLIAISKNFASFYSDSQLKIYIIISAMSLFPSGLALIFNSIIMGLQEYKYLAYRTMLISPINVVLTLVILKMGYGIIGLIIINVIVSFIQFVFYFYIIRRNFSFVTTHVVPLPSEIKNKIFRYNWQVFLIIILDAVVWQRSEIFFLARFHNKPEVAFYSLAYGIIEKAMVFLPSIFSGVLMPTVSELYGKKDHDRLQKLYINATRYLLLITVPICVGMITLSKPLILLLYGSNYSPVAPVLNILLISGCFGIVSSIGSSVQYGTENQNFILKCVSVITIVNILLDLLLIPKFGAIGAAIANSSAQIFAVLIGTIIVTRLLSVRFPFKDLFKIIIASLSMIPGILIILRLNTGISGILFSVILASLVYFAMIICTRLLNRTDVNVLVGLRDNLPPIFHQPLNRFADFIKGL